MQALDNQPTEYQPLSDEFVKLVELEASETIKSSRWLAAQLLQVATVLSLANLTAVGYATANNQAGMLLLASGITGMLLFTYRGGMKISVPLLCRLVALEDIAQSTLNRPLETSISIVLLNVFGTGFLDETKRINRIADRGEKRRAMRELETKMFTKFPTRNGTLILLLAILIQLALIPILVFVFGWKFL